MQIKKSTTDRVRRLLRPMFGACELHGVKVDGKGFEFDIAAHAPLTHNEVMQGLEPAYYYLTAKGFDLGFVWECDPWVCDELENQLGEDYDPERIVIRMKTNYKKEIEK